MARKKKTNGKIMKDKNGKFRYSSFVWIALIVWASYILISQQMNLQKQNNDIADISKKIEVAQRENTELNSTLDMVGTDEYVEKVARKNLGYTMSNEQVFVDSSKSKND